MTDRERRIREIAYHFWEREGRPEGEGHAHRLWLAAEAEFEAEVRAGNGERTEAPAELVKKPARPSSRKIGEPAAEKAARLRANGSEPVPEKSAKKNGTRSAKGKTEEPAKEKPAAAVPRKAKAK